MNRNWGLHKSPSPERSPSLELVYDAATAVLWALLGATAGIGLAACLAVLLFVNMQ